MDDEEPGGAPLPPRDEADSAIRRHVHAALFGTPKPEDVSRDGVPTAVGRFRTTRVLGAGGMGTVLAGHDDALERPVAVKLLHREIGVHHGERLRREAKALAKLSHPNVVTVYEVGTHEGRLFIAMEQVEGQTLGAWMRVEGRSVDEVLDVFLRTGAGLRAAHEQGLVHRDFKPDNVIVGADGRPRILDFGLVLALDETEQGELGLAGPPGDEVELDAVTPHAGSGSLTETGTVLGTPAYMPWEQLCGARTTEASDQFSFCVSLWEALYGARPYPGKTLGTLVESVSRGAIAAPEHPRGPTRLRRALERGLAPQADARWPGMAPLLAELEDIRAATTRKRRSAVLGSAVIVALTGTTWGLTRPGGETKLVQAPAQPRCVSAEERLAGIWDDEVERSVERRYDGAPARVQEYFGQERTLLDAWARTWSEIYTEACASDEAERNPLRYAQRTTCLDQRLLELQIRTVALTDLTPEVAATAASGDYMPFYFPRDCRNEALVESITTYPDGDERQELLDAVLGSRRSSQAAKAVYFGEAGLDYASLVAKEDALRQRIYELGHKPVSADFMLLLANSLSMAGLAEPGKELTAFDEAARTAAGGRNDQAFVLAKVWKLWAIQRSGSDAYYAPSVLEQLPEWEAALERSGWPIYGTLEFRAWQAVVLSMSGQVEAGREAAERAITFAEETFGEDHMFYRRTLQVTANYLQGTPLDAQGRAYRRVEMERTTAALGPDAHALLLPLGQETEALINEERFDDALPLAERTLALALLHHGDAGTSVCNARVALGRIHAVRGDFEAVDALVPEIWEDIEYDVGVFVGIPAEFQAHYSALRGEPDPVALANLRRVRQVSPFATMLIAAVTPLLDGRPTAKTLAAMDEAMKIDSSPQAAAFGNLVRGQLLERAGRLREAADAYGAAAGCECVAINGGITQYGARLGQVRTLRALDDPAAEPIAKAFRERLQKTSSSTLLLERLNLGSPGTAPPRSRRAGG